MSRINDLTFAKMSLNPFKHPSVQDLVKDVYIKKTLAEKALKVVRDIQMEAVQNSEKQLNPGDVANRFCELVEAVFLHGLKSRLSRMALSEMFGIGKGSVQARGLSLTTNTNLPRPDFWSLVRTVTHREGLETINALDQVITDVGRSRSWVRFVINDGTLASCIECIANDPKVLSSFYRSSALLRDDELTSVIVRLFSSLSDVRFTLPLNVASLNLWQPGPLILCGLWQRLEDVESISPVTYAMDVDDYFIREDERSYENLGKKLPLATDQDREHPKARSSEEPFQPHEQKHLADSLGLPASIADEIEQALKINKGGDRTPVVTDASTLKANPKEMSGEYDSLLARSAVGYTQPTGDTGSATIMSWKGGLVGECGGGWSSVFAPPSLNDPTVADVENAANVPVESENSAEESSLDSILNSSARHMHLSLSLDTVPAGTPELSSLLTEVYNTKATGDNNERMPTGTPDRESEDSEDNDFEIIPSPVKENSRILALLNGLGQVPREKGLDEQNFECAGCKCAIGMIFGPYTKCAFDGHLYCNECMGQGTKVEEHVIPSRIVHDWDFRVQPVCHFNKRFLVQYEQEPLLDIRELNVMLYSIVSDLAAVQVLRRQLRFLRLYLFSCQESAKEELKKRLWSREHLYEHVHLYSTLDLLSIPSGSLQKSLEKAVQFAKKHVLLCQLCCQKGFICELCNDPKVIFPFNINETHFCERCSALYHRQCMAERNQSCIKCERKRLREQRLAQQRELDEGSFKS
ncbi:pleckstrin homology domain-containing family M member 1-like [Varroa jacobsoni]|uniref:pleckstrin homology domain-containing family M member 1-like n=1 Tax=Varroa jacobsoni TaxID=62625 RepID=UPI000BF60263|nr:pleckstrin homology domain-containing family M member 1-like [Varroa jacobsoni]